MKMEGSLNETFVPESLAQDVAAPPHDRSPLFATVCVMSIPPAKPATEATPATESIRDEEQADAAKTADDAPAPVHAPRERKMLVRDAYGNDPYGGRDEVELGQAPHELPDPLVSALEATKDSSDKK